MADTVPTKESAVLVDQTDLNMTSIQLSVTALVLILVAMGNSQMSTDTSMAMIDVSPTTVTDSASMAGPEPTPGPEEGAEGGPLLLPEWAIAFIVVGGVFLVLATIAVVGMCVGIATKSR